MCWTVRCSKYSTLRTLTVNSAGFKPFMEYAGSYALFNYRLEDPSQGLEYDNLRLIRAFEHGLDPKSSEAGFVLVHIDMVRNSGPLVDGVMTALDACEHNDRQAFDISMRNIVSSMTKVNNVMDGMSSRFFLSLLQIRRLKLTNARYVGEKQAKWLRLFPYLHIRHYQSDYVPSWRSIWGRLGRTYVVSWWVGCQW